MTRQPFLHAPDPTVRRVRTIDGVLHCTKDGVEYIWSADEGQWVARELVKRGVWTSEPDED